MRSEEPKYTSRFTHLALYTEYSFLDGANKIKALAKEVKEQDMTSVAMTDNVNNNINNSDCENLS